MKVQWIMPVLALLAVAPVAAQQTPGSENSRARTQRLLIERERVPYSGNLTMLMDRRPRLGVTVDLRATNTDSVGALVQSVTPGSPAAKAGIRSGDVITKVDGHSLIERDNARTGEGQSAPGLRLIMLSAGLAPNDTVAVELLRGKDRKTVQLVTEDDDRWSTGGLSGRTWTQQGDSNQSFFQFTPQQNMVRLKELAPFDAPGATRMRMFFGGSPLGDLELAPLNEDLGSYFGTTDGVLVVSAPRESKLNLKGGDVVLTVDGRKPTSPPHLMRILQSYEGGESFRMEIMRNHHRETVTGSVDDPRSPPR